MGSLILSLDFEDSTNTTQPRMQIKWLENTWHKHQLNSASTTDK